MLCMWRQASRLVPALKRLAYFPLTPPFSLRKSYSSRSSFVFFLPRFINSTFPSCSYAESILSELLPRVKPERIIYDRPLSKTTMHLPQLPGSAASLPLRQVTITLPPSDLPTRPPSGGGTSKASAEAETLRLSATSHHKP